VGHRERLAGTGDAHQVLVLLASAYAFRELVDRLRLITLGLVRTNDFEIRHVCALRRWVAIIRM
jgi:hypothetical protein